MRRGEYTIRVHLIEASPTIGGNMVRIGKVFSPDRLTEECAMCSLAPIMSEVAKNRRIHIKTLSKIVGMLGSTASGVAAPACLGPGGMKTVTLRLANASRCAVWIASNFRWNARQSGSIEASPGSPGQ